MTFVIISTTAPQYRELQAIVNTLRAAHERVELVKRQVDEMTDQQVIDQYGIPTGAVTTFRTQLADLMTNMDSAAVFNFMSRMGFDSAA